MTANGTLYTSGSGDSIGMVMNIASSDVSSANIYFGKSLMTQIDKSFLIFYHIMEISIIGYQT